MPETELAGRRRRAASALASDKLDAAVLSSAANLRYFTGFTGSNGLLLLWGARGGALFTDPRYAIQAAGESDCALHVARGPLFVALMRLAARKRLKTIGFEESSVSWESWERLKQNLPPGASLEPASHLLDPLRTLKSAAEIQLIRRSVLANSEAFSQAMRDVRPGMPEFSLAAEIEYKMRLLGAERPAFETIVASGARTALPHARPTAQPIQRDQLLLIDMGASLEGYSSDMTRMAFLGRPGPKVRRLYAAVLEAQLAAIGAVRAGVTAGSVDRVARKVLRGRGLEKAFVHATGHGLGLEIHEAPRLGKRATCSLEAGMVVTVEPGIYFEGFGGIRIEDTVVVTSSGCEVLTPTSKELLLL